METIIFHHVSGETYLARMKGGMILSVAGPCYYKDLTPERIEDHDFTPEDVKWLEEEIAQGRAWRATVMV